MESSCPQHHDALGTPGEHASDVHKRAQNGRARMYVHIG